MIAAFIQARNGSTRLPGKVSMMLKDKTVLEHVVDRVRKASKIDEVFVLTTIDKRDLEIVKLCSNRGIRVFCGSEDDVLDRFYQCAKLIKPDHIVRITADCPMIDPLVIDRVIEKHLSDDYDYTSNTDPETFPDGEDVEIFKFEALRKAWKEAELMSEREHVTPYIKKHPELFKKASVVNEINLKDKRWTLDNQEDYDFISKIYNALYDKNNIFGMKEILEFLSKESELEKINTHLERNSGYKKSLKNDFITSKGE